MYVMFFEKSGVSSWLWLRSSVMCSLYPANAWHHKGQTWFLLLFGHVAALTDTLRLSLWHGCLRSRDWAVFSPTRTCALRSYHQWQQRCFQINLIAEWINKLGCISGRDTMEVNDRAVRDWPTHTAAALFLPVCTEYPESKWEISHSNQFPSTCRKTIRVMCGTEPNHSLPGLSLFLWTLFSWPKMNCGPLHAACQYI